MRASTLVILLWILTAQTRVTIVVEVRSGDRPVEKADVSIGNQTVQTDVQGQATLQTVPGEVTVRVERFGFQSKVIQAAVAGVETTGLQIELEPEITHREEITVTATRSDIRVDDEPLRVEVITQEEVSEKTMMTPGDIAMLLNETSGVRVQVTSPSLGAANVRIQGLRGRYTQLFADGLPLYGGQTGAIGLLQIPPLDLGQVEILKGVASALYGSSALGGVINLVSRKTGTAEHELLLNRTTRGGTDSVLWLAKPINPRWSSSLIGGVHHQKKDDLDDDQWADLPGYRRVVIRPRLYWDDGSGRSVFTTLGATVENRNGGSHDDRFPENLNTRRFDAGVVARLTVGQSLLSIRGSAMTQRHRHQFGNIIENDRHHTVFGEAALSGSRSKHTWVVGSAIQSDLYRSREVSRFNYSYIVPAIFVQDEYAVGSRVTLAASGRWDSHNRYGNFFNPRLSTLLRLGRGFTARASTGTGVFVPTPFIEETEAIGLSGIAALSSLKPERARSASVDLGWNGEGIDVNASAFGSVVRNPLMLTQPLRIVNALEPTRTAGSELFLRVRRGPYAIALTHTAVKSTEISRDLPVREDVPLTPKQTAGITAYWEDEKQGRIGLEFFYTGRQRLEDNPYRQVSVPYWLFGGLIEKRFDFGSIYLNAENLANFRQSRYHPLVRPMPNFDGRRTVDQWAPLDGRVINGGIRLRF